MVALIIVDCQNDFMDDGALPVKGALSLIPRINEVIQQLGDQALVVTTQDWHPPDHSSFDTCGGKWPPHCIEGTVGAELVSELKLPKHFLALAKGQNRTEDGYSAFEESADLFIDGPGLMNLKQALQMHSIEQLYVCGVATDYCVRATVMDARRLGFRVSLITNCIAGVAPDTTDAALLEMAQTEVQFYHHGNDTAENGAASKP